MGHSARRALTIDFPPQVGTLTPTCAWRSSPTGAYRVTRRDDPPGRPLVQHHKTP